MIKILSKKKYWLVTLALLTLPTMGLASDSDYSDNEDDSEPELSEPELKEIITDFVRRHSVDASPQSQKAVQNATKKLLITIKAAEVSRRGSTTTIPAKLHNNLNSTIPPKKIISNFLIPFKYINPINLPADSDLEKILAEMNGNLPDFKGSSSKQCKVYYYNSEKDEFLTARLLAQQIFDFRKKLCKAFGQDEDSIKEQATVLGHDLTDTEKKELGRSKSKEYGRSFYVIPVIKNEDD